MNAFLPRTAFGACRFIRREPAHGRTQQPPKTWPRALAGMLLAGAATAWGPGPALAATSAQRTQPEISASAQPDAGTAACAAPWPLWDDFRTHFMQADGRVVDASTPQLHSSSESQSYAMFFALVANDREAFARIWQWSIDNLAGGDMRRRLPAWLWGKDDQDRWRVLDDNSASDADLWFVYALAEAARLWQAPAYLEDARALLALIEQAEVVSLPGLGPMLLPGAQGFVQPNGLWRLNPSYLPLPVLRRLQSLSDEGPWQVIAANTVTAIEQGSPRGVAADWLAYRAWAPERGGVGADPLKGDTGSYDAIRTYLWAGMTAADDPLAARLLDALHGMQPAVAREGAPPETFYVLSGAARGAGPAGFSAAVLPYLRARGAAELAAAQRLRAEQGLQQGLRQAVAARQAAPYYDFVLGLFGLGWDSQRYRFDRAGRLETLWEKTCPHAATR